MPTTYDVRIWKPKHTRDNGETPTESAGRWMAGHGRRRIRRPRLLRVSGPICSPRARGKAFDTETGRPVSMARTTRDMGWCAFACKFVDMKWPRVAATTRRTHVEALTALTPAMFATTRGKPDDKLIRAALCRWAFNTAKRGAEDCPEEVRAVLRWVERNTRPVSALAKPEILRPMLDSLTVRLDGKPAASSVISRRRKILNNAVEYAVELGLLAANPMPPLKWRAPKAVQVVDPPLRTQPGPGSGIA